MKLYGFPGSPNTWKVRAVVHHLRLPIEFQFVDLINGEQNQPVFRAINPTGRTPALVDGECGMPLAKYPNLSAWFTRLAALPCWSATAPVLPASAAE